MKDHEHMSETPEAQPTVPEGTVRLEARPNHSNVKGVCLIEIWRQSGKRAPNAFWREMLADCTFSLWRYMAPNFAKKALQRAEFTLDKDGHVVHYAARKFDTSTATLDDYRRIEKLRAAYAVSQAPMCCHECQGTKEIQASRPLPGGKVHRFVCDCPVCAPQPEKPEGDEGTTSTAESVEANEKMIDCEECGVEHPTDQHP